MKIKLIFISILFFIVQNIFSQTIDYSKMTIDELKTVKEKAITEEDYGLAQKIKLEIESRKTLDQIKKETKEDLQTAINNNAMAESERLKDKLEKIERIESITVDIEDAVSNEDFNKAMELKKEKESLLAKVNMNSNDAMFKQNNEFVYNENIGSSNCLEYANQKGKLVMVGPAAIFGAKSVDVYESDNIIFYGIDITYSKYINKKFKGKSEDEIGKILDEFNIIANTKISARDYENWMKKKEIIQGEDIFFNYKKRDLSNFITESKYCVSFSDIEEIVKGYVLKETEGIGMVNIISNISRGKSIAGSFERVLLYITFFDIKSREVLFSVKMAGTQLNGGFTGKSTDWANAYKNAARLGFIDLIYKENITQNNQIPLKYRPAE